MYDLVFGLYILLLALTWLYFLFSQTGLGHSSWYMNTINQKLIRLTDKSNMNEDEWRAAIEWIEKQEGDGLWVVLPGDDDQNSVSYADEEELLRDVIKSGDEDENKR